MREFVDKHKFELLLFLFIGVYILYFNTASLLRFENYYTGRFDLGNMAQTVWNTKHGRIFQLTDPNGVNMTSRLAFHADFILILLTPFYFLWSDPRMLLTIQTVVMALGAIFVYLIAFTILKEKKVSLVLAFSYLMFPALQYINLYDFHSVALATTFLLAAFYFIIKKNYALTLVFLALSGLTKENIWAIDALLGLYILYFQKKKILGASIFAISSIAFYYLIWHAIPSALGGQHFALTYYSDFGSTPSGIIKNVLASPVKSLKVATSPQQIVYIRQLFIPLGYLSFLSPLFLIFALPSLGISLLSSNSALHQIYYQYSADVIPFIFISAIYGIRFVLSRFKEITPLTICAILLIFSLTSSRSYGPLPFSRNPSINMFVSPLSNRIVVDNFLSSIPKRYSVASTNNLGSHLSQRQRIYTVPLGIDRADYVLFLLDDPSRFNFSDETSTLQKVENDPKYSLVLKSDDFYAFKRTK